MPVLTIEDVKRINPNALTLADHIAATRKDQPTVIMRSFPKAPTLPILQAGVKVYDPVQRTVEDVKNAYGTHPNVPGNTVVNAILAALGGGNWTFHVSDGSYTAYSTLELQEYMKNFDSTDLLVWIAETFDCDNFASVLNGVVQGFFSGIPFGILWFGPRNPPHNWGHAVNIYYDAYTKKVYCIEPQTDGFFDFNKTIWIPWMVLI